MQYGNSTEAYVERIGALRKTGLDAQMVYAALELRCGIEAKLREQVAQLKDTNKAQRREYRATKLARTLEKSFQSGDQWMLLSVICKELNVRVQLNYFPVSARLQKIHDELGAFLHHPIWKEGAIDGWWQHLRALVKEGYGLLQMSAAGELLVMPVNRVGEWRLAVKLGPDDPRRSLLEQIFDGTHTYEFEPFTITPVSAPTFYEASAEDGGGD